MRPPESELPHLAGATAPLSDRGRSPNRDLCLCGMTSRNREAVHRHSFSTLAPFWDVELSRHHSWRHTSSATDTPPCLMDCENPAVLVLRSCNSPGVLPPTLNHICVGFLEKSIRLFVQSSAF